MARGPIPPTRWLDHLRAHVEVARRGQDPEGVHQIRVASRRLAVWLRLGGRAVLADDLRWLRQRAGRVRDLDVLLAPGLPAALGGWLVEERERARAELLDTLASPRLFGLLAGLCALPHPRAGPARRALARLVGDALSRLDDALDAPRDVTALHRLRRALRKVRYGADWIDRPVGWLPRLQDRLGAVGDRAVLLRELAASPHADELDGLARRLRRELRRSQARALAGAARMRPRLEELAARWSAG